MSIWKEIKCVHFDEEEQKWFVDAWLTDGGLEGGKVIAKVDLQCNVEYIDERAKADAYAQDVIVGVRFDTLADQAYDLYIKDWCASRGYDPKDYDKEHGFNGESFACFYEFLGAEFMDENYMNHLLGGDMDLWLDMINKRRNNPPTLADINNFNKKPGAGKRKLIMSLYLAGLLIKIASIICFYMDFHRPLAIAAIVSVVMACYVERVVSNCKKKNKIAFMIDTAFVLSLLISVIIYVIRS